MHAYLAITKPKTYREAAADPAWVKAMQLEIEALENNNTQSIVNLPPSKKPIGCRWIYKVKYLTLG